MTRDPRELAGAWARFQQHAVTEPLPALAGVLEHCWQVRWSYPEPYRQLIVPHPTVHLTVAGGAWTVQGVRTRHHVRVLDGEGRAAGAAFRPGVFRAFLGTSVSSLTDRGVPAADVLGPLPGPADAGPEEIQAALLERVPVLAPAAHDAVDAVRLVAADPSLTRADELARALGIGLRALQRLFAEHVGVGPKWVIRRYRLEEVVSRLGPGARPDWADVAAELGYTDQAHLAREFRLLFGEPPTHYAARF